jgi:succinate dehydrogenase / fumarate reductase flavoprotein subunit
MQYSPMNDIPYMSRVDAGTIELIRSFGCEIVTSAELVQQFEAVWTPAQKQSHIEAAPGYEYAASVSSGQPMVYLDVSHLDAATLRRRVGGVLEIYEKFMGDDPTKVPMKIFPAVHYTMGGLWVDYDLMSTIPGLFVLGEANFSDHGANRLGASALMQGLADGYFVIPYTLADYLAGFLNKPVSTETDAFRAAQTEVEAGIQKFLSIKGKRTADSFHRELGRIVWDYCGIARTSEGLQKALQLIPALREEFWRDLLIPGGPSQVNQELEKAARIADYFELAELMCRDALDRNESCGGHFRTEYQTEEGEALRDDEHYAYVAAWGWTGDPGRPELHKEPLEFETVQLTQRSYK